jgi:hypothetical protein
MFVACCFSSVRTEKKQRLDGETQPLSPTSMVAVTKVLDDDNLLREIIVRVVFPTTLVRAALVCKRWFGHASDPAFLRRFRKLHPPRLLGYYISEGPSAGQLDAPRFVPMLPQPAELATVMPRLAGYTFGAHDIMHCRNGSVLTKRHERTRLTHGVHRPLCAEKGMKFVPPCPRVQDHSIRKFSAILSKEEASGLSYFCVLGDSTEEAGKSTARVYMLQDGVWCLRTTATCLHDLYSFPEAVLVGNKIYMPSASSDDIVVLDMTASSFSTVQLPQGVRYDYFKTMLSGANDASGVYLMHVMDFQLRIWLHKGDNWLLINTICLNEMPILGMSDHTLEGKDIAHAVISQVGDNGQFVFLRSAQCIFYLDIKCRILRKVYENRVNHQWFGDIHPFMMVWPPSFPALEGDPARFAF